MRLVPGDAGDGLVVNVEGSRDLAIAIALTNALADGSSLLGGEVGLTAKPLTATLGLGDALEGSLPHAESRLFEAVSSYNLSHRLVEATNDLTLVADQVLLLPLPSPDQRRA
jgi:hypothetical protein